MQLLKCKILGFGRSLLFVGIITTQLFAQHNYKTAMHLSTRFFGAQRCGDTKSWIHGPCHTKDGQAEGVNLAGGWHDCGDHIKFGQTNAYSAALLLLMYNRFPEPYKLFGDNYAPDYSQGTKNGIPDVLDEVKIFTDFLIKACVNGKAFYQIGNANQDHSNCCEPEYQSTLAATAGGDGRKAYYVTSGASNFCGTAAAALALMNLCYKEFDASYADQCLLKAKEYYTIGDKSHASVASQDGEAYEGDGWADDMAFGAIELYRATGDVAYKDAAKAFHDETGYDMPTYFFMDYGNCAPAVNFELFKEIMSTKYRTELLTEIAIIKDSTVNSMAKFGYAHFDAHTQEWASLKYAATAAMEAFLCHSLTNDETVYAFGKKNVDFILGSHPYLCADAPANFSFLIGYNELKGGSPDQPHHCSAFYRKADWSWSTWNNPAIANIKELPGALVGGPKSPGSNYVDARTDPVGNEVCIYYNAPLVGALAYIVKRENTPIRHTVAIASALTKQLPVTLKITGATSVSIPENTDRNLALHVFDLQGRLLGIVSCNGKTKINVKEELGIGQEVVVVKPVYALR